MTAPAKWSERYDEREPDPEIDSLPMFNFHSTHDFRDMEKVGE